MVFFDLELCNLDVNCVSISFFCSGSVTLSDDKIVLPATVLQQLVDARVAFPCFFRILRSDAPTDAASMDSVPCWYQASPRYVPLSLGLLCTDCECGWTIVCTCASVSLVVRWLGHSYASVHEFSAPDGMAFVPRGFFSILGVPEGTPLTFSVFHPPSGTFLRLRATSHQVNNMDQLSHLHPRHYVDKQFLLCFLVRFVIFCAVYGFGGTSAPILDGTRVEASSVLG